MKKYALYIIALADDVDRTEHVVDAFENLATRDEAVALKREAFGENGVWTGCDVYARICEICEE